MRTRSMPSHSGDSGRDETRSKLGNHSMGRRSRVPREFREKNASVVLHATITVDGGFTENVDWTTAACCSPWLRPACGAGLWLATPHLTWDNAAPHAAKW